VSCLSAPRRSTPDAGQVVRPYRGWHYYPDPIIPAAPKIPGHEKFVNTDCPACSSCPPAGTVVHEFHRVNGQGYNSFVPKAPTGPLEKPAPGDGFGPRGDFDHGGCVIGAFLYESYDIKALACSAPRREILDAIRLLPRQGGYELRPGYEGVRPATTASTGNAPRTSLFVGVRPGPWPLGEDCIYQPWLVEHEAGSTTSTTRPMAASNRWARHCPGTCWPGRRFEGIRSCATGPKATMSGFVRMARCSATGSLTMFYFGVGKGGAHIMAAFSATCSTGPPIRTALHAGGHPAAWTRPMPTKFPSSSSPGVKRSSCIIAPPEPGAVHWAVDLETLHLKSKE